MAISDQPTRAKPPVVVLGSGVTALGVCRALHRSGIKSHLVSADNDFAKRSRYASALGATATETNHSSDLVDLLGRLSLDKAVLMPCSDTWNSAVANLPTEVVGSFPSSISSGPAVETLTDKNRLRSTLEELEIPMPRTVPVAGPDDLALVTDADLPNFFLKPRDSQAFSRRFHLKAFAVSNRTDAIDKLKMMEDAGIGAVFQEYVPGPMDAHIFVDGFIDREGEIKALFARRRLLMFPTDFGNSSLMVSIPIDEAAAAVESLKSLLPHLGYRGVFSAEFKQDIRDGLFKLLEVNVRPWWFVDFAALSGIDVCAMAYRDALGLDIEPKFSYTPGKRHMIFPQHIQALRKLRSEGKLTLREWLRISHRASDAVFRWTDPLPGISLALSRVRRPGRG